VTLMSCTRGRQAAFLDRELIRFDRLLPMVHYDPALTLIAMDPNAL
jgi:hypothetical protein